MLRFYLLYAFPSSALTVLDLTLFIHHVLKVVDDGVSGQVVEGLVPQLLVHLLLTFTSTQERLDVEHHLPLHGFPAQQAGHHGLAVASVLVGGSSQIRHPVLLWSLCLT